MIGPFRGGRTVGATGVPGQPNVFYIGVNNGGVWKTTDYGRVWKPIFDDQPTGSIGALAVAPSNPNIVYVGSGEGLQRPDLSTGDGMYKSTDARQDLDGTSACATGSRSPPSSSIRRIPTASSSPCSGHPYGANAERGVFRSTDGGKTFEKVLYKDENTGAIALAFDPHNAADRLRRAVGGAAGTVGERRLARSRAAACSNPPMAARLGRSSPKGCLPRRTAWAASASRVAPSDPQRLYAMVDAAGERRRLPLRRRRRKLAARQRRQRVWGRGSDFAEVKVDPKNKDIVYVANTATYRSTDGGKTFTAIKGAPGGDDYHTVWINPDNPKIILLASDQGATISVNGGADLEFAGTTSRRRSSITSVTDNQFPYWVYGGQQESGSAGVSSRGNDGQITFREWHPVGVEEYGYVAPDPLNPNIIYGGKVTRFDRATGQVQDVGPEALRGGKYRIPAHGAAAVLARRSARPLFRDQRALQDHATAAITGRSSAPTCRARSPRCRRASAFTDAEGWHASRAAASSTPSRRRTRTSTRSGPAPTMA